MNESGKTYLKEQMPLLLQWDVFGFARQPKEPFSLVFQLSSRKHRPLRRGMSLRLLLFRVFVLSFCCFLWPTFVSDFFKNAGVTCLFVFPWDKQIVLTI